MNLRALRGFTRRGLLWSLGFVLLLFLLVGLALETTAGRSALLRAALGAIETHTGLVAEAEGLDVSLLGRDVRVRALSLARPGSAPLVRVAELRLAWGRLPLGRGLMPEAIELEGVQIDLRRGLDGRWNLPVGRGELAPVAAGPPTLPLRTSLRDVGVTVSDSVSGLEARVGGIFLEATGSRLETAGTLDIKDPLAWRVGSQSGEIAFTPAAFRLDRTFTLTGWSARTDEATVRLKGTWSDVFASGSLGLTFDADLDLRRLAARSATPLPIDGSLHLDGQISVARGEPRAEVTWRGDEARAAGRPMRTAGHATITGKGLEVSAASLKVAGGSVDGSGRVVFATTEASRIDARWSGLDLGSLLMPSGPRAESYPLRGLLAGHLRASWPGLAWPQANAQMVLEARPGGTDGPRGLPIEGDARLDLRGGRWNLEMRAHSREDARLTGQFEGVLGARDFADTTLAGRLDLELLDMSPLVAALGLEPVSGQGRGSVFASGTLASPRASVEVRGVGLRVRESPPVQLNAQGTIDRASLVVEVADLHAGSAHAQATGRLLFENGGLDGRYDLDLPDLAAFASSLPAGFEPRGALHGRGTLGGTSTEPQATLSATGTDLRLAGQTAETARFALRLDGPWLRAESFELAQAEGKLSATGAYDRRLGVFSLSVEGRSFEISPLPARLAGPEPVPFGGRVDMDFQGSGSVAAPEGHGRVTLTDGRWEGRRLGPVAADLGLSEKGLRVDLRADDLSARVEATVELGAPHAFSISSRFEGSDLGTAGTLLGQEASVLSGTATLRLQAQGSFDDPDRATGSLALDEIDGMIRGRAVRLQQAARIEAGPGRVRVDALDLVVGAGRLRVDGALDAQGQGVLRGSVEGRLGDFAGLLQDRATLSESKEKFDGTADVSFVVSGPPKRPRVSAKGRLEEGVFRFEDKPGKPRRPPIESVNAQFSLEAGTLRLDRGEAAFSGANLVASGDVTASFLKRWLPTRFVEGYPGLAPRAALRARVEGDAGQVLAPLLNDSVRGSGRVAVLTADLAADDLRPDALEGEIRLEGADLHTSDAALDQEKAATIRIGDGRLVLEGATWTGPGTALRVAGSATFGPLSDPVGGALVDLEASGQGDLRLLQAFSRGIESGGTGTFRLKVTGAPRALRPEGEIELRGGALRHRPTRMALDGLTGTMRWGAAGFELVGLSGSLNGGPLQASGALRRRESGPGFEGAIRLQARNAYVEWPPGLRAGLRANLTLEPAEAGLKLAGTLRVIDGMYRTRDYFSVQVLELVDRFSTGSSPSPLDPLRLDVTLKSGEDVELDAVDGRLSVGLDLHFGGSVGLPIVGGRLTAAPGGQLYMSGRTYDLESAILDFSRGAGFEPYIQARASTQVSEYTVIADIAGPATRVQTRFASTPPLGEQDIIALLTSGRTMGAGGTGSEADALSMASGGMLGKTGQRLGLDSLKIESHADPQSLDFDPTAVNAEADPASRLTFSKRLTANLRATFSRSLSKAGSYTWIVAWKPRPPFEVRVVQRDDQTGALEFRHDITIGGGRVEEAPARRRRRRRTGETVSTVRITGDAVAARPSDLKLREGQAFDYERWLADRDRLEEDLARAGHNEGRVLASREAPAAEPGAPRRRVVALVYDVRQGPATRLTIEGVPSPSPLRDRIERAWRLGDYSRSVEEEAHALTRAHLYERGYLRAQVTARVTRSPPGDAKTLAVRAEAGPRATSRQILFEGNARVSTERLEALVREPPRLQAAWLRPDDLRDAVQAVYESEGLLAAKVEVAGPTFVGDRARLTVKIDEGPVVPIGEVSVAGAERISAQTVRAAADLAVGQPFKPADVESAKLRVETAYRSLGYNDATVSSHGAIEPATGVMTIALEVKEGPREVLAEIAVEGGRAKAQARARRLLDLAAGEPVVLDEWTEARRRIYETGLFRRVDLEPTPSPDAPVGEGDRAIKATLRVEEWPALRLRYGLQMLTGGNLASEEGRKDLQAGAVAEVSRQTLFGRAAAAGLSVQVRKDEQEARAYLSLPRTFGTPLRSSLFLTVTPERADDDALGGRVDIRKTELTWEERLRVTRKLEFAAAYKVQWSRFEPVPDPGDVEPVKLTLARLVGTALFDARNDLIDTSRGLFSSASFEWGGGAIGSEFPLKRSFFQQFVYVPVRPGLVFGVAGRAELASGQGTAFLGNDRLRAGGANTVRGYADDALTSRTFYNLLGGSTTLLVLNAELRFPIRGPVRGVVFGDGAISKARFTEESTRESIWSTGLGVRYVTPVGILRLDFGIPLDEGLKPKRGHVYFSLGQVF